jgi:magnesium-transporting ATPase (P-type)
VVAEGRRVVANMERVSSLFVTKTVYAAVFALTIGISGAVFPFLPRHMSLVSELTIGVPAFLLSFRAADEPCRPGYLSRVLRFAIPAGVVAASVTLAGYWLVKSAPVGANLEQARTASTLALTTIALWVLYRLMRPVDRYDLALLSALVVAFAVVVSAGPTRRFYALEWPPLTGIVGVAAITMGSIFGLQVALRWMRLPEWRWLRRLIGDDR